MSNNNNSLSAEKLYRFVKADERLPAPGWSGITRVGNCSDNSFYHREHGFCEADIVGIPYAPEYQQEIEWLEELPENAVSNLLAELQLLREENERLKSKMQAAEKLVLELWAGTEPAYEGDNVKPPTTRARELFSEWKKLKQQSK